jgi:ribosome maturation factor RimP
MDVKEAVMRGGSRHVPARPGRAAGRSPARKPGKAPAGRGEAATDGASGTAAQAGRPLGPAPDTDKIAAVAGPVVHALGMDLESVKVTSAGRRRLLRLVVDSDGGVSLDDAALASRELSAKLDASDVMGDMPYTLEVSSPGVDRPLTQPRHWQRAVGRLVRVPLSPSVAGHANSAAGPGKVATGKPGAGQGKPGHGKAAGPQGKAGPGKAGTTAGGAVQGRVVAADAAEVTLDIDGEHRRFGYAVLGAGLVQIEFDRPGEPSDTGTPPEDRGPESRGPGAEPDGH